MTFARMTWTASALALCLASPALAWPEAGYPVPDEPAQVIIAAADGGVIERPIPEPVPVVVDLAPAPTDRESPAPSPVAVEGTAPTPASAEPIVEQAAPIAPVAVAALPSFGPTSPDRLPALQPAPDLESALPPPPEVPPLDLSGIMPQPAREPEIREPEIIVVAPPAIAVPVIETPAPIVTVALDLAPHIAERVQAAVRSTRLPDREEQFIRQFYAERGHQPLWVDANGFTARARALQAALAGADADGLRAIDYRVVLASTEARALADADVALSVAAVLFARDARGGRLEPRRVSALMTPKLELPATGDLMARLAASTDAAALLTSFQPQHPGYERLRAKLAQVRASRPEPAIPSVRIPTGPAIRVGMRDQRVTLLRARFGLGPSDDRTYDRALATQVAEFQRENGLPANGILNRQTQELLNGGPASRLEGDLIATMERWRWLPADLGENHVIVNVPEFKVRKIEDRQVVHEARVVVGRPERPTPIFSDMMDHVVINPSWTLPPTILREDVLPRLAADPGYAERRGFEVIRRGNSVTVRQPPGPNNALGVVKLMFPNDHAVYLHDTPTRSHFAHTRRAYSSGCVRVERPLKLTELVLGGAKAGWSEQRLRGMVGFGERTIRLANRLPIHLVYMTHEVGADGSLTVHEDIYGFHQRTRTALGL